MIGTFWNMCRACPSVPVDKELKPSNLYNRNHIIRNEISKSIYPKKEEIKITSQPISNFASSRINEIYLQNAPKKSVSMNGFKNKESNPQETVPVHKKTAGPKNESDQKVLKNARTVPDFEINNLENTRSDETDGEFKSEYKKNFQPFNKYDYDENKGVFEKRVAPINSFNTSEVDSPSSNWYKEVVHLRQKANQYRYRGWGTELIPDHIVQLYNNQLLVWEQVSRRSTLSALSLASTAHITRDDPSKDEKENRRHSPVKSLTRAKSAKASQATSTHKSKTAEKKSGGQTKVPSKSQTASSPKKDGEVEDFPSLENEQIVKSPLEPTRVKSPEQIVIRSPEPVNWTVPLDTGKTFTVTQNIREGDIAPKSLSEAKAWTSGSAPPPPASVSAPSH